MAIRDVNNNGVPDLVVANNLGDTVSVLLGTGTGAFQSGTEFNVGFSPASVAIADLNGDGKLDLAVGGSGQVSVLLGQGNGAFPNRQQLESGSWLTQVALADLNGDGTSDLAASGQESSTVRVWLSSRGILLDGAGQWQNANLNLNAFRGHASALSSASTLPIKPATFSRAGTSTMSLSAPISC